MAAPPLPCPRCATPLPSADWNSGEMAPCPVCGTPTQTEVFPAFLRPAPTGAIPQRILIEGEASCFYHPDKRAASHCANCGRFLCALCDVELSGRHLCPGCIESGQRQGTLNDLETKRTLYDGTALALAVLPLLAAATVVLAPLTMLTAPTAIVVALSGWNKPGSLVPRGRVRALLAIALAGLQILGWGVAIYAMVKNS